ncbi:CaiB/BaiF CoA transferase family protein [Caulobacter soli]|uniref:CaiB/BaiF CoA transferase family protein n=1 Tax=Caulobacter soli TaxID=2708539 RepID=UPI0013EE0314|nr:CaiB/BaiF CoA-transferase family protein [Caulobacter soli]
MGFQPLAGVRVLDFTAMPPGGFCTVSLADQGAEVIRVEAPADKGKPSLVVRQVALSRGKRSITLDQRNPASIEILRRLARTVDVVVETAKPGAMEARGFGYTQARTENPKLIWCSITGFGQTGPYAERPGHDLSYLAHSGLLGALKSDLPWQPEISLSLQAGALTAVIGIQGALLQRERTGEGCHLDISLSEAATWLLTCGINPLSDRPYAIPASPDRKLYECADGRFVAVASAERRTWDALCDGLGLPDLKPALHQATEADRATEALSQAFRARPAGEWVERLSAAGAAVTLVNHASQLLDDPQVRARAAVVQCADTPTPANPVRLMGPDGSHGQTNVTPPVLVGDDTHAVLASAGFTDSEIADLAAADLI